ncbi:hypothetical protein SAMN05216298_3908 [Glycomyces sambucus]|uniref:DUF1269 domain-containing protein n=1 Tax=Glycomyces sambucus TaxID=380244 RepID=A0A1G9K948_9ACTN|nr:DUF6325 family protein [Glycomyces sambucus]SDL45934.1 hypothetical protein SAMN05216298_3908 [Glycomyces sambucus]
MEDRAPVDLVLVEFSGGRFDGAILAELESLTAAGTITVIDALLVSRTEDGSVEWIEAAAADERLASLVGDPAGLLAAEDAEAVAAELEPGTAIGMLVFEHAWAAALAASIRGKGGRVVDWERVPAAALAELAAT